MLECTKKRNKMRTRFYPYIPRAVDRDYIEELLELQKLNEEDEELDEEYKRRLIQKGKRQWKIDNYKRKSGKFRATISTHFMRTRPCKY